MSDQPETVETGRGRRLPPRPAGRRPGGRRPGRASAAPAAAAPPGPARRPCSTSRSSSATSSRIGLDRPRQPRHGHALGGWAAIPGAEVVAVCDIRADRATPAADPVAAAGHARPAEYGGSKRTRSQQMLNRERARPRLHRDAVGVPLRAGQGRPARRGERRRRAAHRDRARQLWDLVDTSEPTRKNLMLSENCSYGRNELAMLKMAHEGLFGEVTKRPRRLPARPARAAVRGRVLHGRLAQALAHPQHRELLPHARAGADRRRHGHQPRRPHDHALGDRHRAEGAGRLPGALRPARHRSWRETYVNGDLVSCMIETAQRPGHPGRARRQFAASVQPDQRARRQPRHLRGLRRHVTTGARVYVEPLHGGHSWRDFDAAARVRPLAVEGARATRRTTAATAGWTTSCSGASCSRSAPGTCPTSTSTTRPPGARRCR